MADNDCEAKLARLEKYTEEEARRSTRRLGVALVSGVGLAAGTFALGWWLKGRNSSCRITLQARPVNQNGNGG
ncbi:MAG: hypothetical protein H6713_42880 [Myxococcales bacterium]|nr:hypothetical protein [Myxococcales bacterium]MCB9756710.1 hypothetical protein [Myxococcales bacterium]